MGRGGFATSAFEETGFLAPDGTIGQDTPLVWVEFTDSDGALHVSAKVSQADPSTYYGGFKEPRVKEWGPIVRALSDIAGALQSVDLTWTWMDTDRVVRALLAGAATRYFVNRGVILRMLTDAERRLGLPARTIACGLVSGYQPLPNLAFQMSLQDPLTRRFLRNLPNSDQLPQRRIAAADFPGASADALGLGVPIIYGAQSDQVQTSVDLAAAMPLTLDTALSPLSSVHAFDVGPLGGGFTGRIDVIVTGVLGTTETPISNAGGTYWTDPRGVLACWNQDPAYDSYRIYFFQPVGDTPWGWTPQNGRTGIEFCRVLTHDNTTFDGQYGHDMSALCSGQADGAAFPDTNDPEEGWDLNETGGTTAASSTGGTAGTYHGTPTLGVEWPDGALAARFDGVDDQVSVAGVGGYTGAFSVKVRVRFTFQPSDFTVLAGRLDYGSAGWAIGVHSSGQFTFYAPGAFSMASSVGLNDGRVHEVLAHSDGTTARLFVDGRLVATQALTAPLSVASGTLFRIGAAGSTAARFFTGEVDRVQLYDYALFVASVDTGKGAVSPIYVGQEVVGGTPYHTFLVAGHACKAIDDLYVDGTPQHLSTDDTQAGVGGIWLVPGYAGWTALLGATPFLTRNSHRYTVIYGKVGQRGPDRGAGIITQASASESQAETSVQPLTLNVRGIEEVGDGSGALLTAVADQYRHALENWIYGSYETGAWLAAAVFDAEPTVAVLDAASFSAARVRAAGRISGGYVGAGIIGAKGQLRGARDVIAAFNRSADVQAGFNQRGQYFISIFDDEIAATVPVLRAGEEIIAASFTIEDDPAEHFNVIPYHYAKDDTGRLAAGWAGVDEEADALSIAPGTGYGMRLSMAPYELDFIRDAAIAQDIVIRKLVQHTDPPRRARFTMALSGFSLEMGTIVRVTHPEGIGAQGWVDYPVRLERHAADPDALTVNLVGRAVPWLEGGS